MYNRVIDIQSFRHRYTYDSQKNLLLSEKNLSVYQASDTETGQKVVVQIFQGHGPKPEVFLSESERVLHYEHVNLAKYLAFWVIRTQNFFGEEVFSLVSIHEFIPGISLRQWNYEPEHHRDIFVGILNGLRYLHNEGFSHGNLNLDNIILQEQNGIIIPRLINYGYSKLFQAKKTSSGNLLLGTGQYMPPEKILSRNLSHFTGSGDLWAFGVIVHEILLGKSPFGSQREGHSLAYIFDKILHLAVSSPLIVEEPYGNIILSCLQKDPHKRGSIDHLIGLLNPPSSPSTPISPSSGIKDIAPFTIARIIFLGNDANLRSSLIETLTGHPHKSMEESISVSSYHFSTKGKTIEVTCWNFADIEILYHTYRFLFSPNCIYILALKNESDNQTFSQQVRTSIIEATSGKNTPVIPILSEKWSGSKMDKKLFTREVESLIENLDHVNTHLPANWLDIQLELRALKEDFIDYGEFRKICRRHQVETVDQEKLGAFLHEQGLVLHFRDEAALRGISILNPNWISSAVLAIMNAPDLEKQKGLISIEELSDILDPEKYPPEKHFVLLELLFKFQMGFPIGERREYFLLPDQLPKEKPEYYWPKEKNLCFRYQFTFLPTFFFRRFIIKVHKYTENDKLWRHGILLFENETRAEILENFEENTLNIRINGPNAQRFLIIIRNKLAELITSLGNLEIRQGIPCVCVACRSNPAPVYHNFEEIQEYLANKLLTKVCTKSFRQVSINELLGEPEKTQDQPILSFLPENEEPEQKKENTFLGYIAKNARQSNARTILFLASNPSETAQLQLGRECSEIDNGLARASHRLEFKLEQKWAVTPRDFRRALMDFKPEFVHFSGHGLSRTPIGGNDYRNLSWDDPNTGGLVFEDANGNHQIVSTQSLKTLFGLFPNVRCVLLNACYSQNQAKAIAHSIDYVIGMKRPITDKAAITFAVSFYDAIGANESIEFAFRYACSAIELEGHSGSDIPVLLKKEKS